MLIDENIEKYLKKVGLLDSEIKVYLNLLNVDFSSISNLASLAKIPRTTVSENIKKLLEKGIVTKTISGSRSLYIAEDPLKIKSILSAKKVNLETKVRQIEHIEEQLPDIAKSIYDFIPKSKKQSDVTIRYYEGKKQVETVYEEALKANEFRAYYNPIELVKVYPNSGQLFFQALKKNKKMELWEIMTDSEKAREYAGSISHSRFHAKFIPNKIEFQIVDYFMFDNKVAFVELYAIPKAVIIHNQSFYSHVRVIHKIMWELLPNI